LPFWQVAAADARRFLLDTRHAHQNAPRLARFSAYAAPLAGRRFDAGGHFIASPFFVAFSITCGGAFAQPRVGAKSQAKKTPKTGGALRAARAHAGRMTLFDFLSRKPATAPAPANPAPDPAAVERERAERERVRAWVREELDAALDEPADADGEKATP
jgi:hypothetical protein